MNYWLFVLASVNCVIFLSSNEVESRFGYMAAKYASQFSGQIYHNNLIFARKAKHVMQCLRKCARHRNCSAFTFTPGDKVGDCRGHVTGEDGEDNDDSSPSPSTIAYVMLERFDMNELYESHHEPSSQLHDDCELESECAAPEDEDRWICFDSKCLCALGYRYRISNGDCVYDCDDLADVFLDYSGYQLSESIISNTPDLLLFNGTQSHQECQNTCLEDPECSSVNFLETATTVSCEGYKNPPEPLEESDFNPSVTGAVFKMRKCK